MLSCVVLASGKGKRFGGNKLMVKIGENPLIFHTLTSIPEDCFDEILVVTKYTQIAELVLKMGGKFRVVMNPDEEAELGATVRLGISEVNPKSEGCMFCVGDQPFQKKSTLQNLVNTFLEASKTETSEKKPVIVALAYKGNRGNPVIFPKSCFEELAALSDDQSGSTVIKKNEELLILCEAKDALELKDIDCKEDLPQNK